MNPLRTLFDPPELSDEAAYQMLDFLNELATAFENHYAPQLQRYQEPDLSNQPDLFEDFDDPFAPF